MVLLQPRPASGQGWEADAPGRKLLPTRPGGGACAPLAATSRTLLPCSLLTRLPDWVGMPPALPVCDQGWLYLPGSPAQLMSCHKGGLGCSSRSALVGARTRIGRGTAAGGTLPAAQLMCRCNSSLQSRSWPRRREAERAGRRPRRRRKRRRHPAAGGPQGPLQRAWPIPTITSGALQACTRPFKVGVR